MNIEEINKQAYHFVHIINSELRKKEQNKEFKGSLAQTEPILVLDNIIETILYKLVSCQTVLNMWIVFNVLEKNLDLISKI